jgi:antitoxin (DNA-binding transcriptional repressor) of toxin-antitoxin stability system
MTFITTNEIARDPSEFIRRMEAGESFVVTSEEAPLAEVRRLPFQRGVRPYGLCAGQFTVPDDFNEPLPEEFLQSFNGS